MKVSPKVALNFIDFNIKFKASPTSKPFYIIISE
jgi:hypothetical protein